MKTNKYGMGWLDKDTIAIQWGVEDVLFQAKVRNIKLTRKECRQVLEECLKNHDATLGLSWDILDHHIMTMFGDRVGRAA